MKTYSEHPYLADVPRERILCFTGHRPERLPTGDKLRALTALLHHYIDLAVQQGYTHFYTGLADGVDYLAAEYLFTLRRTHPEIGIVGVQPCEDYHEFFRLRGYSLPRLEYMLANVDALVTMPGSYHNSRVFLLRNNYMVERSAAVIAVCSDGRSGSMQTFQYAIKQGLAYCRIRLDRNRNKFTVPELQTWEVQRSGF